VNAIEVLLDGFARVPESMRAAMQGLDDEQIHWQPNPESNSIAWLAWHLTRVQDHHVSELAEQPQAWVADRWASRFGMEADPQNIGFGHSPEQVRAFRAPDADTLLAYHDAVLERTRAYLGMIGDTDLDRAIADTRWNPPPTYGVRLVSVCNDMTQHVGQMAYARGLLSGRGWQRF
jgi:uncharacterized damage-inducible protein DinB